MEGSKFNASRFVLTETVLDPKFDLILDRWIGDYPDADTLFNGILHSKHGSVGGFCGNPEMDP